MDNAFVFEASNIIPVLEDGIISGKIILEGHKSLNNTVESLIVDTRITEARRLLSVLKTTAPQ